MMIILPRVLFSTEDTVLCLFPVTSQPGDSQDLDLIFKVKGFDIKNWK